MKGIFSKDSFIGLDLGHHSIKAVQVDKTPSGWRIAKLASAPTPPDTIRDGVVIDPPVLGLVLKEMLRSHHFSATSASIGVSGGNVVVRPVKMPKMNEVALRKSIRFEAGRYIPNSVEDSYIDFEILGEAEGSQMEVLIAAAPKDIVDGRVAACRHAGIDVEHVEIGAFATMRSVYEASTHPDWTEKTCAIIDMGAASTNLVLITSGTMAMVRTIPQGGAHLTESLVKQFKISEEDAESGKSQLNLVDLIQDKNAQENPPLRSLQPQVDELLREIRRSINYWQTQQTGMSTKQIDLLLLAGGGSKFAGIDRYLEHKLGLAAQVVDIFQKDCFVGNGLENYAGAEWAAAIGLAMPLAKTASSGKAQKLSSEPKKASVKLGKKAKAPVAEVVLDAALESVETPESKEAPKKPAKRKTTKKAAEEKAPETVSEVPEAFRHKAGPKESASEEPAAHAEASSPEAALTEESAKPAKKGLFSFSVLKKSSKDSKAATAAPSAKPEAAKAEDAKPKKPLFSVFGKKAKAEPQSPSDQEEAA